jgi:hypothetical protein
MSSEDSKQKRTVHPLLTVAGLVGGVVGYYCGITLLIPFAMAFVFLLLARRFASEGVMPFNMALAVVFGHLVWMFIGGLSAKTGFAPIILDMTITVAGLIWLTLRPGLGPVILLGVYEGISLIVNIFAILHFEFGSAGHKALTAHLALRLYAIAALVSGYRQFRKQKPEYGAGFPEINA